MRWLNHPGRRWLATLAALALLLGSAGCGSGRYPVTGRVVFDDGTPLDEGIVICEMKEGNRPVLARGSLGRDGTFRLGTQRPGDGVRPGKYRVLVVPRGLTQAERSTRAPIIDPRFEHFETSGLTLEVKDGKQVLNITVTRPQHARR
jgi:hypothetical protein